MPANKEKMDEILGVAPSYKEDVEITKKNIKSHFSATYDGKGDLDEDYTTARETLQGLIVSGNNALDKVLQLASESDHPRTFEVTANLISTVSNVAKDLIDLQKTMKDITKPVKGEGSDNNDEESKEKLIHTSPNALLDEIEDEEEQKSYGDGEE